MKKLMLSAFVAVLALASCNKEDSTPVNNPLKSVEVSIGNKIITKGAAGDKINAGEAVQVSNIKIFLTDDSGNTYDAKNDAGTADAQTYFEGTAVATGVTAEFHYVDPACTKVIAVANVGNVTLEEAMDMVLEVGEQQDQTAIALYAEGILTATDEQHEAPPHAAIEGVEYLTDVYEAELTLTPRISRFEVDGFAVRFNNAKEPNFGTINITQLAFQNYYPTTPLATGIETGTLVKHIADFNVQSDVYAWLNSTEEEKAGWFRDRFDAITIAAPEGGTGVVTQDLATPLAYHMFSCKTTPVLVIQLTADGQPSFLYSKSIRKEDGTQITNFEEGRIYRMTAGTEAEGEDGGDGYIPFDEEDIDPMDRCLDITVKVHDWIVELVYPEF